MKVAARFPIKPNSWLFYLIIISHISVFVSAVVLLSGYWIMSTILFICCISFYYTRLQYFRITHSPDDLCWSGDNWLMNMASSNSAVVYMELMPTSWVTSHLCLLKFSENSKEYTWLFTRKSLGERLYRELCYLAKLNINSTENPRR